MFVLKNKLTVGVLINFYKSKKKKKKKKKNEI